MSSQTVEIPKIEFPAKLSPLFEPHPYKVLPGGRGSSKCLGIGTPILMFDGSLRNVEDVVVGDQVMGPDSLPRNVLSVTKGVGELFKVTQTSAMQYVANDEHLLSVRDPNLMATLKIKAKHYAQYPPSVTKLYHGYRRVAGNPYATTGTLAVESIGPGDYYGFAVDGDHLFCLGDGTVTHNSWSVGRAFLLIGMKKKERFLCLREKQLSIKESVHQLLCDQIDAMNLRHFYRTTDTAIRGANGTTFSFFGLQSHTVDSVRSVEGATKIWVEEAQNVGKASWKVLIPTVRTEGREFWITFNPLLETGDTYKRFVANPPPGAVVIQMNWRDNPWFPAVLEQERLYAKATMEDEEYQNVWEGQPIRSIPGAIYAAQIAKLYAEDRATIVRYDPRLKVHVVQDLGFGDINAVGFFQRKLSELRCIRAEGYTRMLNHEVAAEIKKLPYNFGAVWLPHDGFAEGRKGDTEEQIYRNFGFLVKRVPDFPVETGIRRAKEVFGQTYFDQQLTESMLEGLKHYKRSKSNERVGSPVHDAEGNSDWADMFRYAALSCRQFWNESDLQIPTSARPFQQADPFMGVLGG